MVRIEPVDDDTYIYDYTPIWDFSNFSVTDSSDLPISTTSYYTYRGPGVSGGLSSINAWAAYAFQKAMGSFTSIKYGGDDEDKDKRKEVIGKDV